MRNRALPSVMAFVAQATQPAGALYATAKLLRDEAESMVPTSILNRFASLLAGG